MSVSSMLQKYIDSDYFPQKHKLTKNDATNCSYFDYRDKTQTHIWISDVDFVAILGCDKIVLRFNRLPNSLLLSLKIPTVSKMRVREMR